MELSLDTASDMASVALSREGCLLAELTWRCERQHSTQLMPSVDRLLQSLSASKDDLRAIFVCIGPGGYAGLRVGVSAAKGLAFALEIPLVGVGRLETEAYAHAAYPGPVCAVHRAGRGEVAWAAYEGPPQRWREIIAPRLSKADEVLSQLPEGALFCGEIEGEMAEALAERAEHIASPAASVRRAGYLAELAWRRLQAGHEDDPKALVPLYLREPAIGPQKP
jgi:tRNA threonylcarbamoyladenosine biosynthesis protein TsaB